MKTTLLALGAVLAPLCASQAHAREVQAKIMTTFCRSIADMDQWTRYVMAGDDVAAQGIFEPKNLEHTPGLSGKAVPSVLTSFADQPWHRR